MTDPEVKVKQWSFCTICKGRGCPQCEGTGKTVDTVLFSNIPHQDQVGYLWQLNGSQEEEE